MIERPNGFKPLRRTNIFLCEILDFFSLLDDKCKISCGIIFAPNFVKVYSLLLPAVCDLSETIILCVTDLILKFSSAN